MHKISFIVQDLGDARAFGYIFGSKDKGYRFFGIKTEKAARQASLISNRSALVPSIVINLLTSRMYKLKLVHQSHFCFRCCGAGFSSTLLSFFRNLSFLIRGLGPKMNTFLMSHPFPLKWNRTQAAQISVNCSTQPLPPQKNNFDNVRFELIPFWQ